MFERIASRQKDWLTEVGLIFEASKSFDRIGFELLGQTKFQIRKSAPKPDLANHRASPLSLSLNFSKLCSQIAQFRFSSVCFSCLSRISLCSQNEHTNRVEFQFRSFQIIHLSACKLALIGRWYVRCFFKRR